MVSGYWHQARSQDLEKGGLFWKSEKNANDLDPNFHCSWIRIIRFVRKLRRNFSESSKIQTFFQPKTGDLQKKRSSPKLRLIFRPKSKIQTFFLPKNRWSPNKKKNSSPELRLIFWLKSEIQTLFQAESRHVLHNFGTQFLLGGAVFNFSPTIGLKSTKNVRFCILHKPMGGGSSPPPPPLATLLTGTYRSLLWVILRNERILRDKRNLINVVFVLAFLC